MTFHKINLAKKKGKSKEDDSPSVSKETLMLNKSEFPIKPFKGTKAYLGQLEGEESLKAERKRKSRTDFSDDVYHQKEKKMKYDPSKVMSKLEEFSDVWNDCPNVENPKSNFEIVPNHKNEIKPFKKESNFERRSGSKTSDISKRSIPDKNAKANNFMDNCHLETDDHNLRDLSIKSSRFETGRNAINKFEHQRNEHHKKKEESTPKPVKYDSILAEMKRKKAVQEQSQLHADHKNIIKKALSSMDSNQKANKKIVFSDNEEIEEYQTRANVSRKINQMKTKNKQLFEDDDSSDPDTELKVNSQYEGVKGQKLLELQSKFASDSRFKLDSRFHESESENEKEEGSAENLDTDGEKKRQLEILESIVKQPIRPLSESRKLSSKEYDDSLMVRFDPTREDHHKYLLKPQKPSHEKEEIPYKKSKQSKKEKNSSPDLGASKPEVSSEKVYAVKEDLKEVLKKESKTKFSLLKLFGSKEEESNTQEGSKSLKKLKYATKNPFRYDSSESDSEEEEKEKDKSVAKPTTTPSWRTTLFFTDNDSRFKEAEEFLKLPEELEGDQEFAEKRKMLKDFIRHKLKNSNRKKDPFKKKLGGMKKKVFNKRKGK